MIHTAFILDFCGTRRSRRDRPPGHAAMLGALEGSGGLYWWPPHSQLLARRPPGDGRHTCGKASPNPARPSLKPWCWPRPARECARQRGAAAALGAPAQATTVCAHAAAALARSKGVSAPIGEAQETAGPAGLLAGRPLPGWRWKAALRGACMPWPRGPGAALDCRGHRRGAGPCLARGIAADEAQGPFRLAYGALCGHRQPELERPHRSSLGWRPGKRMLLADMRDSGYFS